jgi:hypothetical protein
LQSCRYHALAYASAPDPKGANRRPCRDAAPLKPVGGVASSRRSRSSELSSSPAQQTPKTLSRKEVWVSSSLMGVAPWVTRS